MSFGIKTNEGARHGVHEPGERPGTRAQVRHVRMSAYKARVVLDLIRGKEALEADAILQFTERDAARVIRKCLASAVANAENNDGIDPEILFVSACYADEGTTIKRWRPRARGRATRIRKRTCHITVIVAPLSAEQQERRRARDEARLASGGTRRTRTASEARSARVARSRRKDEAASPGADEVDDTEVLDDEAAVSADVEVVEAEMADAAEAADEVEDVTDEVEDATDDEDDAADEAGEKD
ncbi:MAG: 50S ribosomal protein L22 [Acidimicrobiia bacterium]|nr:50S ribosomal protein L22 [Acidimicrobiia bacterium]